MGRVPTPDGPPDARPLSEHLWFVEGTGARRIEVPAGDFWAQVMSGAPTDRAVAHVVVSDGWLVTQYDLDGSTDHEEMHPNGDELHYLVSGDLDLVLVRDTGTQRITMQPGSMANVPRGVWHRIEARTPSRAVAITAGRGTQHRTPDPEPGSAP